MVVMLYVRFPLSLRNVEDLAFERGIDICHETVRKWVSRFGPMFASKIRARRVAAMRQHTHWKWHLDEVYVRVQGHRPTHVALEPRRAMQADRVQWPGRVPGQGARHDRPRAPMDL